MPGTRLSMWGASATLKLAAPLCHPTGESQGWGTGNDLPKVTRPQLGKARVTQLHLPRQPLPFQFRSLLPWSAPPSEQPSVFQLCPGPGPPRTLPQLVRLHPHLPGKHSPARYLCCRCSRHLKCPPPYRRPHLTSAVHFWGTDPSPSLVPAPGSERCKTRPHQAPLSAS